MISEKTIVKLLLENYGFDVTDLGRGCGSGDHRGNGAAAPCTVGGTQRADDNDSACYGRDDQAAAGGRALVQGGCRRCSADAGIRRPHRCGQICKGCNGNGPLCGGNQCGSALRKTERIPF